MFHNDKFRAVLVNLLGRDLSHIQQDSMALNERLLYDINMGYQDPEKVSPHQSVKYYPKEAQYLHPWSFENIGEQYGVNKLHDFIPLRDYLELPANCADRVLAGVMKGRNRRFEMDEEARKEAEAKHKARQKPGSGHHTPEQAVAELEEQLRRGNL